MDHTEEEEAAEVVSDVEEVTEEVAEDEDAVEDESEPEAIEDAVASEQITELTARVSELEAANAVLRDQLASYKDGAADTNEWGFSLDDEIDEDELDAIDEFAANYK